MLLREIPGLERAGVVERIEYAPLAGKRPRPAGRNARLPAHGGDVQLDLVRVRIDGSWGYGWSSVSRARGQELIGKPASGVFDSSGVTPGFREIEFPLLDWAAKRTACPAYRLWDCTDPPAGETVGAAEVPCYDTSLYFDEPDDADDAAAADAMRAFVAMGQARGHRSFKVKIGRGARHMPVLDGTRRDIAVIRAVRDAAGAAGTVMVDANNGYNLNITKDVLDATADCNLFWMEEPFHEDPVLYADLRDWCAARGLSTMIADGEGRADPSIVSWAREGVIDVLQYDLKGYGFHRWLELSADLAGTSVRFAPHNYGGAFGNYASCHLAQVIDRFLFVEWDEASVDGIDASGYAISDGVVRIPDSPGFGLGVDENHFASTRDQAGWSA